MGFCLFFKKEKVVLNEEHVDSEWLNLNDFIKRIKWDLNKEELKKVLEKAVNKELYFKKEKIDEFRKKAA